MKKKFTPISDILRKLVQDFGLQEKFQEFQVLDAWEKIVGDSIGAHTFAYSFKNYILFVKVDSSVWMQQLALLKRDFIQRFNKHFEKKLVKEIVFKLADEEEVRNKKWQKT